MVETNLLSRLSHALTRINQTQPRNIPSPPTQPRRASVAILIRIRPNEDDDEWLSEQYDADGQPLPGSDAERIMSASHLDGLTGGESSSSEKQAGASGVSDLPRAGQRGVSESFVSHVSAADASFMGASGVSGLTDEVNNSAVDLAGESTGELRSSGVRLSPASSSHPDAAADRASAGASTPPSTSEALTHLTLQRFFSLPWVQRGQPEVLYIKRASRETDKWSAHVAFPGGRQEEGDENGLYTAMRETWEEIGLDLAEKEFVNVGKLDDREITTSLGKRLLMVLSPYVFVQTSPFSPIPDLQPSEVASAHWIPLSLLYTPKPKWGVTSVDIASRLAPKSPAVRWSLRALVGKMDFRCILLPNRPVAVAETDEDDGLESLTVRSATYEADEHDRPDLKLWGLTLGMTLDMLAQMSTMPGATPSSKVQESMPSFAHLLREPMPTAYNLVARLRDELHLSPPPAATAMAPSMTSVFPRFSYPDVNFWIWVFGWRYRNVVRSWERNIGTGMEQSVNWSGMALGAFYSAVRRALVVAILLRAMGFLSTASAILWLLGRRIRRGRRGQSGFGLDEILPSLDGKA
jgi:8-oxo-dGTP pyrophosphatase MutT (NUDIX family)